METLRTSASILTYIEKVGVGANAQDVFFFIKQTKIKRFFKQAAHHSAG